jgi:ribosome-binding factor A
MAQGTRPARIGEEIRQEISVILAREVHDPGVGFVTVTQVKVSPDLLLARIYYTQMGDDRARRETRLALDRATPFLRRQIGQRLRLRRVPVLEFHFDEGVGHQARVEQILFDLEAERRERAAAAGGGGDDTSTATDDQTADRPARDDEEGA